MNFRRGPAPRAMVVLCILAVWLGGCAPSPRPTSGPAPSPAAAAPVGGSPVTGSPPAARPVAAARVRAASQRLAGEAAVFIATDRGYFREEGVDLETIVFSNASEMIPALATEQLETAVVGPNPAMLNAVARGVPMKVVLDQGSFRPGQGHQALVVRKEVYERGRGHRLEDLRGLSMAITPPGKGTTTACALAAGLQRAGLSLDDLDIQPLSFPDMVGAFANGAVDSAMMSEPFMTRSLRQGTIVRVMGLDQIYPYFTLGMMGFSQGLYANRPVAKGVVRAYVRAIREFLDSRAGRTGDSHRAELEEIIARNTGIDASTVHEMDLPGFNPNGLPNQEGMVYCYRFFRELGLVPEPISDAAFAALWGTDLVEEALQEIGRLPDN